MALAGGSSGQEEEAEGRERTFCRAAEHFLWVSATSLRASWVFVCEMGAWFGCKNVFSFPPSFFSLFSPHFLGSVRKESSCFLPL